MYQDSIDTSASASGKLEDSTKLRNARRLFEDAIDHTANAHVEAHRATRFYHNTEGEGQWDADDLAYLREQERPVFSFNMIKPKLDTFLGMYADAQRTPVVAPAGGEESDQLLADVINAVKDQVLEEAGYEALQARMLKTGSITGECAMHIEVEPSEEGDDWVRINLYRILPFEIHWDIASVEPDRKDARYVFWDRWLSKEEFTEAYPDHKDNWDVMSKSGEEYEGFGDNYSMQESNSGESWTSDDDYSSDRYYRYYYDKRKRKMRVIRYEFKKFTTKFYAVDEQTKQKTEINKEDKQRVELAQTMGAPIKLLEMRVEVVKVCEFAGMTLLAEYDTAGPFEDFSLVSYCYDVDEETGTAYGFVRNMFDPQMEFNKGKSLEIEYLAQSTAPGVIAEQDAIPDEDDFTQQSRTPGGTAIVKKNALTEGRVQDRTPSPPSPAIMARTESALTLLSEVSAIPSSAAMTAAEHQQAGVTVAIRYHKQRQTVSTPFSHHEAAQKQIVDKIVQAIIAVMPDDQMEMIVSADGKYKFGNGRVAEMVEVPPQQQPGPQGPQQPGPQGPQQPGPQQMAPGQQMQQQGPQMVPKAMADLRSVRSMKYNLDMEYTSENSTLRMLELDLLMQIAQIGTPVDPEVLVEKVTNSRPLRARLKKYVEKSERAEQEGLAAQNAALKAQNDGFLQIEAMKSQEDTRHNTAEEQLKLSDQQIKARLKHLEIWERADDSEKQQMMDRAKFALSIQQAAQPGA